MFHFMIYHQCPMHPYYFAQLLKECKELSIDNSYNMEIVVEITFMNRQWSITKETSIDKTVRKCFKNFLLRLGAGEFNGWNYNHPDLK